MPNGGMVAVLQPDSDTRFDTVTVNGGLLLLRLIKPFKYSLI
jgi:hypothetical protein